VTIRDRSHPPVPTIFLGLSLPATALFSFLKETRGITSDRLAFLIVPFGRGPPADFFKGAVAWFAATPHRLALEESARNHEFSNVEVRGDPNAGHNYSRKDTYEGRHGVAGSHAAGE